MTKLTTLPLLNTPARLARPEGACSRRSPDDPALTVMTDLQHHRAITISPDETLKFAEKLMIGAGVRLLLVLNARNRLAGLITSHDLRGERALAATAREKISHDALTVAQVMIPAARIETIPLAAVRHAQVRDIVKLLRQHGRQHALVTEPGEGKDTLTVCGIFSITQIGRQLGVTIDPSERVQSFAEIEHLIAPE
jgi:CBS domain-containing protein